MSSIIILFISMVALLITIELGWNNNFREALNLEMKTDIIKSIKIAAKMIGVFVAFYIIYLGM